MPNTLATSGGTITLPEDLLWTDEFAWSPVMQQIEISLGGSAIIEISTQLALRPITLGGDRNSAWVARTTIESLRAAEAAQGDTPMTLTLIDGRTFSVLFRGAGSSPAVSAEQIIGVLSPDPTTRDGFDCFFTLKLMQVA